LQTTSARDRDTDHCKQHPLETETRPAYRPLQTTSARDRDTASLQIIANNVS